MGYVHDVQGAVSTKGHGKMSNERVQQFTNDDHWLRRREALVVRVVVVNSAHFWF